MSEDYDAIILGGGIAGSGLGAVLAKAGKSVLILEETTTYKDMVRGEWIAPRGVIEAQRTGLYDVLTRANDYHIPRHLEFGDGIDPVAAAANTFPLAFLPGVPGPLTLGHPQACQVLLDAAVENGATAVRGVGELLLGSDKWDEGLLEPYVEERTERMRRLRLAAAMVGPDMLPPEALAEEALERVVRA